MFGQRARKPAFSKLPPAAATLPPQRTEGGRSPSELDQSSTSPDVLLSLPKFTESGEEDGRFGWTTADSFEGTQVFGETGSGKTSGSGAAIARALLGRGFGGLVLTAKTTDVYDWLNPSDGFLRQAGLDAADPNKVIVLGERLTSDKRQPREDKPFPLDLTKTFNFLDYEFQKTGRATFNLVQLFLTALESGSQSNTSHDDAYWLDALRQLLTNAIDLVILATGRVTLPDILEVIQSAPHSLEQARSAKWQSRQPACWQMLEQAERNLRKQAEATQAESKGEGSRMLAANLRNFNQITGYWLREFAGLADRTRSVIVSTFTSKVTGLTRWPLFELFASGSVGDSTFVDIVEATRQGKIVIVNLPVKRYTEVGRFAQVLLKTVWQRGVERNPDPSHPVFLWADEAQFFATKEDMLFQTTARSSGCATVYLTQNICNYYAMMSGRDPKSAADALLGNLATKIFHANGDPTTNDWAKRLFGNEAVWLSNKSLQTQGGASLGSSQTTPAPVVNVKDFATLRRGGKRHGHIVDAIIFRSGFKHAEQKVTVLRTSFEQWPHGGSGNVK